MSKNIFSLQFLHRCHYIFRFDGVLSKMQNWRPEVSEFEFQLYIYIYIIYIYYIYIIFVIDGSSFFKITDEQNTLRIPKYGGQNLAY